MSRSSYLQDSRAPLLRYVGLPRTLPAPSAGDSPAVLKLLVFVLPLGMDTFAVSAALGLRPLPPSRRFRISLLLTLFEMVMPLVGLFLGRGLGSAIGSGASYAAVAVLVAVGAWLLFGSESSEQERLDRLAAGQGLTTIALGLSISLDELAIGLSIGLLRLPIWFAIVLIGLQAFLFAQIGLRLGARLGEHMRERAERAAGLALVALGALLLIEHVT